MARLLGRWKWLVGSLVLVVVASGLLAAYLWRDDLGKVPRLGSTTLTIVPGIHLLGDLGPSVAYAIETPEGLVLVDSGLESDTSRFQSEVGKLGLDWRTVLAIFLTHAHGDHCGGAAPLRGETGAKVYAGAGDAGVLREGTSREAFFSTFHMPNHSPHPTPVDVALKGGETFEFGNVRIHALCLPGHTPGSTCYLMERGGLRVLFTGDVIMQLTGPNAIGTYSAYLAPRYRGNAKTFLPSLRRLRAMAVPDLVLPGHPGSDPTPQSPRLTQERWEEMLDEGIHDMETLLARYQADGADFLDGNPRQLLPDLYYLGDHEGVAVYGLFASSRFFVINAPGSSGFVDFLNTRMNQLGLKPTEPTAVLLTSCSEPETAGLADLVERFHAQVVAPAAGLEGLRESCPPGTTFVPAEDLPNRGWFEVTPIPMRGRGVAPCAYILPWAEKTVLITGQIPVSFAREAVSDLMSDLSGSRDLALEYLMSINRLDGLKPDLWLPSVPSDGANANLYEESWKGILSHNYRAGYHVLARSELPADTP